MVNDECRRLAALFIALNCWGAMDAGATAGGVRVKVEADQVVRTVDARLFGVNTAIWDGLLGTPETVAALRELDLQALRFPGGGIADEYHWASGTLGTNTRPCASSFADFVYLATNIHAQVFITVNYGSGTPEEAAAWVRHANVTNHWGFKYWEISNEAYGNWEHDENSPPHDPVTYARRATEYFQQMKAADPSTKIGVVVTGTWKERAGVLLDALKQMRLGTFVAQGYQGWNAKMLATLKELGITPDWLSLHHYPQNISGYEDDASLLQSTAHWQADAAVLRRQLTTYFGAVNTNIELLCTENNSTSQNTGKQTTSILNGLYLVDSFGQIAQTEFKAFLWWDLRNMQDRKANNSPALYGWRQYGDHGIMSGNDVRYPTFYALKLLKYFARGGDRTVRATSDHKLLAVCAARRADGTLALLVINKSPDATLKAGVEIAGFQPKAEAITYSYGIPQDEAARTGTGSPDIAQAAFRGAAGNFPCKFPPYSATVMVLSPSTAK
jgi:alpha-L-arabinofuranosidase